MKRYSEDERRALVGEFETSGMSAAAFCRQAGITAVTLSQWRRRLGAGSPKRAGPGPAPAPQWVPVRVGAKGDLGNPYVLATGWFQMEVPQGFALREVEALWRMAIQVEGQGVGS